MTAGPAHPTDVTTSIQARKLAGTPAGGQFAGVAHAETATTLQPDSDIVVVDASEVKFRADVDALARFVADHGRKPSAGSTDPHERRLGMRLTRIRRSWRGQERAKTTPERVAYLDDVAPFWSDGMDRSAVADGRPVLEFDREARFRGQVDALGEFFGAHGRSPSSRSTDPTEKASGDFLSNVRNPQSSNIRWTQERQEYADQVAPLWAEGLAERGTKAFRARAEEVGAFCTRHGRPPTRWAGADDAELSLASFLSKARRAATSDIGTWDAERQALLDELVPDWNIVRSHHTAEQNAQSIADFYATHGRKPKDTGDGTEESRLACVIAKARWAARRKGGTLSPELRKALDEAAPWWKAQLKE